MWLKKIKNKKFIIALSIIIFIILFSSNSVMSLSNCYKITRSYLDKNYSSLNTEITSCKFDFNKNYYVSKINVSKSEDSTFYVHIKNDGTIYGDTFKNRNINTYNRISDNINRYVNIIFDGNLDYNIKNMRAFLSKNIKLDSLILDIPFNIEDEYINVSIYVRIEEDYNNKKTIDIMNSIKNIMLINKIKLDEITVEFNNSSVINVKANEINEDIILNKNVSK